MISDERLDYFEKLYAMGRLVDEVAIIQELKQWRELGRALMKYDHLYSHIGGTFVDLALRRRIRELLARSQETQIEGEKMQMMPDGSIQPYVDKGEPRQTFKITGYDEDKKD